MGSLLGKQGGRTEVRRRLKPAPHLMAVLSLLMVTASGQTPQQSPKTSVTFKAGANLVIVDVTVKDKSGNAIDSLSKNDFTVLEDGKPQKVDIFELQKLEMAA